MCLVVSFCVWLCLVLFGVAGCCTTVRQTFEVLEAQMGVKGDRRAALAMYQEDRIHEIVDKLPITKVGKDCIKMPA